MNQSHFFPALLLAGLLALVGGGSHAATLAYWRFEDGQPGAMISAGPAVVPDTAGGGNDPAVASADQPAYTADVPFSSVPQTGTKNVGGVEFRGQSDFFTRDQKINSFNFGPTGSNAWTIELSFKMRRLDGVNRLCGRDGNSPGGETRGPLQILTVGQEGGELFDIRVEMLDGGNGFRDVASERIYRVGRWYNVAATATGNSLSLYVDQLDGKGYQLAGTKAINGAANATTGAFSLGRGWNGEPADWMTGKIDEVRISDVALAPAQFLFTSPNGAGILAPPVADESPPAPLKDPLFLGADPDAAVFGEQYWMYPTGQYLGPGNPVFFAYSSPDRKTWTKHGPILQFKDIPWIYADGEPSHHPWAPGIATKDGKYYFYYSVGPQGRTPSRIGVAVADTPAGPFKDKGEALLTGGQGFEAIDAMVFQDPASGKYYFYAGGSAGAKLRVFELALDMMNFAREIPVDTPPKFTEGAFMHYRNGIYYLSYSHGWWKGPSYSMHYATSKTPYGPWEYRGPILVSDETRKGPGHHSFIQEPKTGDWFIVYHRWQHPTGGNPFQARGGRSIAIEKINYGPDGAILPITMTDDGIPLLQASAPAVGRQDFLDKDLAVNSVGGKIYGVKMVGDTGLLQRGDDVGELLGDSQEPIRV